MNVIVLVHLQLPLLLDLSFGTYLMFREDVDVRFPRPSLISNLPEEYIECERQIKDSKRKKEKMLEDIKREQALLDNAKFNFSRKKEEFLRFLADSSSYVSQVMA